MIGFVGDYHYSGAFLDGQKYAIIRNGDALQRVRKVLPGGNPVIWQTPDPMTLEVLDILRHETLGLTAIGEWAWSRAESIRRGYAAIMLKDEADRFEQVAARCLETTSTVPPHNRSTLGES